MKNVNDNDLVTIKHAQQLLNVKKKVLYSMIESGQLTTQKIDHEIKIDKKSLRRLSTYSYYDDQHEHQVEMDDISQSVQEMISEWT